MTETKHHFYRGEKVLIEATVVSYDQGRPFGAVTIEIPYGFLVEDAERVDGFAATLPQVAVWPLDDSGVDAPYDDDYYSGYYEGADR